jgi:dephospho-CoA kinase
MIDLHELHPPRAGSLVLGVVGGIASGKSAVARLLAGPRGVVIDADRLAREVLALPEVAAEVGAALGPDVLAPDGSIDRARLGSRVFASAADRELLESFTHPRIRARIRAELDAARAAKAQRIVLDVPLLLENDDRHHLAKECDALVFVDADERVRDARAVAERGWPSGEVARRERTQMPLSAKRARADHVIENRGSINDLEREVGRALQRLLRT